MGLMTAMSMASTELPLEEQLAYHLQHNHYPPIPVSMVQPCIEALDAYWDDDIDREIFLPDGCYYKNQIVAPAGQIIYQLHLSAWLDPEEE